MPNNDMLAVTKPIGHDNHVDEDIRNCLKLGLGESFITFAGAGSGKTFSLEKALNYLKSQFQEEFLQLSKEVAVVTFTNNAADEINARVQRNPIFSISTIHSFCWLTIAGFNEDIRQWFLSEIPIELQNLKEQERRGRAGKASEARKRSILRLTEKMEWLAAPQEFKYDPNGVNSAKNALSHTDVLKLFSHFVTDKPLMREMLANKYPFILVDESQDTNRDVINALFAFQKEQVGKTVVGLFGESSELNFFANTVLPIVEASKAKDSFETMRILRENNSPLLEETVFAANESDPLRVARLAKNALQSVASNSDVSFQDILTVIAENNLLPIPPKLLSFVRIPDEILPQTDTTVPDALTHLETPKDDDDFDAWAAALEVPFQQVQGYREYINGASYSEHIKG